MLKQLVGRPAEWITTFESTLEFLLFLIRNVQFLKYGYIQLHFIKMLKQIVGRLAK